MDRAPPVSRVATIDESRAPEGRGPSVFELLSIAEILPAPTAGKWTLAGSKT